MALVVQSLEHLRCDHRLGHQRDPRVDLAAVGHRQRRGAALRGAEALPRREARQADKEVSPLEDPVEPLPGPKGTLAFSVKDASKLRGNASTSSIFKFFHVFSMFFL